MQTAALLKLYEERVRRNPGILARIRSFAANIMRANNVANMTDARYRNAIGGLEQLFNYRRA